MSAFTNCNVLCSFSNDDDFLGIRSVLSLKEVIVSNKSRSVTLYDVNNQKHVHSWTLKAGLTLTSPVISLPATTDFLTVQSKNVIRQFSKGHLNIDKGKKFQCAHPINRLLSVDQRLVVVHENGRICTWDQLNEDKNDTQTLSPEEQIVWCDGASYGSSTYVCVLTQHQKTGRNQIYLHRLGDDGLWQIQQKELVAPADDSCRLLCCCVQNTDHTLKLISLWSNKELYEDDMMGSSERRSVFKIAALNPRVAMTALDKSHVAILGVEKSVNNARKVGLALLDIQFGIMRDWKTLSDHCSSPAKLELTKHGDHILFAWNKQVLCYEFHCQLSTLSSVLGGGHTTHIPSHVTANWPSEQVPKKQKIESQISTYLEKLTDPSRTATHDEFCKTFSAFQEILAKRTHKPVISDHLMRQLIQRFEDDKKIWSTEILGSIISLIQIPPSVSNQLCGLLAAHGETRLLHSCLQHIHDVTEDALITCLQRFLSCDKDGLMSEAPDQIHAVSCAPSVTDQRAVFINSVLCSPYNDVFLIEGLRKLSFARILDLLRYLHEILLNADDVLPVAKEGNSQLSVVKVVDWISMLLDSHFTDLVLSVEARSLLVNIHQIVSMQLQYYDELGSLEVMLSQLKEQCELPQRKNTGLYSIEVLHIH